MKIFVRMLFIAVLILPDTHLRAFDQHKFQYISPLPGSGMVSRGTNVIIRPGDPIDPASLQHSSLLRVAGSRSGHHGGRLTLSDDSRTVLFLPDKPFWTGESVTVQLNPGLRTASGQQVGPLAFQFFVTGTPVVHPSASSFAAEFEGSGDSSVVGSDMPGMRKRNPASSINDLLPSGFPQINVDISGDPAPGYIFLSNLATNSSVSYIPFLMILDNSGKPIFHARMPSFCTDFKVQPNGLLSFFSTSLGYFLVMDSSYAIVDSWRCGNGYETDEHELRLLPNGHALLLGVDPETVRMDTVVAGGLPNAIVRGTIIQELDPSKNVVFQWRSWDHYKITDATHENLTATTIDYVHANSLEINADGSLLLSARHMDEITKIDRQTGETIWRFGGKNNQFTIVNDSIGFSHQHAVRRLSDGHITLFDNGNFHSPHFSRAMEFVMDEDHKIATLVWQYRHSPDVYGSAMGYVQRLENGNTLIGWGTGSTAVTEVTPDGTRVLDLRLPANTFSYRAYRYPWNRTFPSSSPAAGISGDFILPQNYPNPFNSSTTIEFSLPAPENVTLKIYNILGEEVSSLVSGQLSGGTYSVQWDGTNWPSGTYFYRLKAGNFVMAKRLMLLR